MIETNDAKIMDKYKNLFKDKKKWIIKPENASLEQKFVVNSYNDMIIG